MRAWEPNHHHREPAGVLIARFTATLTPWEAESQADQAATAHLNVDW